MIPEITKENYTQYYDRFTQVILQYRDAGGLGKPLSDFLHRAWKASWSEDEWKQEVIEDAASQMIGFCIPSRYIRFPDSGSFVSTWQSGGTGR